MGDNGRGGVVGGCVVFGSSSRGRAKGSISAMCPSISMAKGSGSSPAASSCMASSVSLAVSLSSPSSSSSGDGVDNRAYTSGIASSRSSRRPTAKEATTKGVKTSGMERTTRLTLEFREILNPPL